MKSHNQTNQSTLAQSSNGFYKNKKLVRTLWTGGGIYKEVEGEEE